MLKSSGLVLALAVAVAGGVQEKPKFSGFWVPDMSRYTMSKHLKAGQKGGPPAPPADAAGTPQLPSLRITHDEPHLLIEFVGPDGAVLSSMRLTTTGEDNVNERAGGPLVHKSHCEWDGKTLKIHWRLERSGALVMSGLDTWRLSDDLATLTQTSTMEDSKSSSETTAVFARK